METLRHSNCILVAVDDACRGNGTTSAQVYYSAYAQWDSSEGANRRRRLDQLEGGVDRLRSV